MSEPRILSTIKYQKKNLDANITTSTTDIASLRFTGLEVGKLYRVTVVAHVQTSATNSDAFLQVNAHGNNKIYAGINDNAAVTQPQGAFLGFSSSIIFEATSTTLTTNAIIVGSGSILKSASPDNDTFMILEELPNHEQTSQW